MQHILRYFAEHREQHIKELCAFLEIPSISAKKDHAQDVRKAAEWFAAHLRQCGLPDVVLHETRGNPVVVGQTQHKPGRSTVLIYGHYDVQPPEPLALWESPPFSPTVKGQHLVARGAADDKGQVFIHAKVAEAFHRVRAETPVNLKFLIEGEEEVGSPALAPFLKDHAAELACDVILVSDTHMLGLRSPSITTALRGITAYQITVKTAKNDLHSGNFGGAIANPIQVLADLLTRCKDRSGKVKIPSFYDDVQRPSAAQRRHLRAVPHDDHKYAKSVGAPQVFGEKGFSTPARVGARPTFEINGIWGGYQGEGLKTVLPCEAHAKVSMRLVPNQRPQKIGAALRQFLRDNTPPYAHVKVTHLGDNGLPVLTNLDSPYVRVAADAVREVFGKPAVLALEGGSVPVLADLQRTLKSEPILLGFGLPDDNLHAPNEKFDLRMFDKGVRTVARFLSALGE